MFSVNTLALRKDMNDESTVGEDFFMRGQGMNQATEALYLEKKK